MSQGNMNRPGDWNCRSCQHLNFQRRDSCHRCGEPRYGGCIVTGVFDFSFLNGTRGTSSFTGPDVRPGDWYCNIGDCGAHNFASRSSCFKCGAFKDELGGSGGGGGGGGGGGFDCGADISRGRSFGIGGGTGSAGRYAWKPGDWICNRLGCNEHNFASRMKCFRCNAPRESDTILSSYYS